MNETGKITDKVEEILTKLEEKNNLPKITPEQNYDIHKRIDEDMRSVELYYEVGARISRESAAKVIINY